MLYPSKRLFTQKIQCTFKVDIPDMGHLDGGRERDVRVYRTFFARIHHTQPLVLDQSPEQSPTATLASVHSHIFVREGWVER